MTFLDQLVQNCRRFPNKPALEFMADGPVKAVTYRQLEDGVLRTMSYLKSKGVRPGDRVALQLPKCLPFIYLHLAIMRLEAISLPLNPGYPAHELCYFLQDAEVSLFFTDRATHAGLRPMLAATPAIGETVALDFSSDQEFEALVADYDPQDSRKLPVPQDSNVTCLMIYTSGTTGRPKGAELTHGNLTANINSLQEAWGWRDDDVLLHVLPIFHVHGLLVALHGALNAGATAILQARFDPEQTLQILCDRNCTLLMAVPAIHRRLVNAPGSVNAGA